MKRENIVIIVSLLMSLFIYLFYRTERTLVNELAIRLISIGGYGQLRTAIAQALPLSDVVIYSFPEGFWVLCITLTSKRYFISLNGWRVNGIYIPLLTCISFEMLQLFHVTNGRFDP